MKTTIDPRASMGLDYLACRVLGHNWPRPAPGMYTVTGRSGNRATQVEQVVKCLCCGTVRTDVFAILRDSSMERTGRRYDYPDGYLLPKPDADHAVPTLHRADYGYTVMSRLMPGLKW